MTPLTMFSSVIVPTYLADEFRRRAQIDGLCPEEALIHLLSDWVNDPEPKPDWKDLAKSLYESEQDLASWGNADCDVLLRDRGYTAGQLRRCRNCGIRVPKVLRILPWKACSDDCADALWIRANGSGVESA
jgi:hypothetical protein